MDKNYRNGGKSVKCGMRNWKEICAKCADGEIEPEYCEYYGEPNGCNSPTYMEHPPVGNAAAMREALELFVEYSELVCKMGIFTRDRLIEITTKAKSALSAPARNCDVMSLAVAKKAWFAKEIMPRLDGDLPLGKEISFEEWFVAPAAEQKEGFR